MTKSTRRTAVTTINGVKAKAIIFHPLHDQKTLPREAYRHSLYGSYTTADKASHRDLTALFEDQALCCKKNISVSEGGSPLGASAQKPLGRPFQHVVMRV